jgi:hypothetical protein
MQPNPILHLTDIGSGKVRLSFQMDISAEAFKDIRSFYALDSKEELTCAIVDLFRSELELKLTQYEQNDLFDIDTY